jgi:uncharacterized protein
MAIIIPPLSVIYLHYAKQAKMNMIGTLTKQQMEHVLRCGLIGRIGYRIGEAMYVVPVTYVFDGKYIYAHSKEGLKIQAMRKNPKICFEVDSIENMMNWRCVIVQGQFQELTKIEEQQKAIKILNDRLMPYLLSETMRPKGFEKMPETVEKNRKPVIYRIQIIEMSGRYEKNLYVG